MTGMTTSKRWLAKMLILACLAGTVAGASAQNSQPSRVTFSQQAPVPSVVRNARMPRGPHIVLPQNECSASFWNPYAADAEEITNAPNRVQQDDLAAIDPADSVQLLPAEVVEPQGRVQQLTGEVIQSASRVEELASERIGGAAPNGSDRAEFSLDNLWAR